MTIPTAIANAAMMWATEAFVAIYILIPVYDAFLLAGVV